MRFLSKLLTLVQLITVFVSHPERIAAHVVWAYPAPRPSSDVKAFPCGQGSVWDEGPITELSVGSNELVFDEFICHRGDMVRIAISMHNDDSYDEHVLLDRLPHNDLCNDDENPLMAVNVTIPDVDCVSNECSLQIIQVMASKFRGSTCENPSGIANMCGRFGWMYFSCARVRIAGQLATIPKTFVDYYGELSPVGYTWPLETEWYRNSPEDVWRLNPTNAQIAETDATNPTTSMTTTTQSITTVTEAPVPEEIPSDNADVATLKSSTIHHPSLLASFLLAVGSGRLVMSS